MNPHQKYASIGIIHILLTKETEIKLVQRLLLTSILITVTSIKIYVTTLNYFISYFLIQISVPKSNIDNINNKPKYSYFTIFLSVLIIYFFEHVLNVRWFMLKAENSNSSLFFNGALEFCQTLQLCVFCLIFASSVFISTIREKFIYSKNKIMLSVCMSLNQIWIEWWISPKPTGKM